MIVKSVRNGNATLVLNVVQAGVLLKALDLIRKPIELALISDGLNSIGVSCTERNVEAHLESIRVVLDEHMGDFFPHLAMQCDECNCEPSEPSPGSGMIH